MAEVPIFGLLETSVGPLRVTVTDDGVCRLDFGAHIRPNVQTWFQSHFGRLPQPGSHPVLAQALESLDGYFARQLRVLPVPLDLRGTRFQTRVWTELLRIPYGRTTTYGGLARTVGQPGAAQAVGRALGANPVPVIVPCHRVLGSDGSLTGFAGGLEVKSQLLELEGTLGLRTQRLPQVPLPIGVG